MKLTVFPVNEQLSGLVMVSAGCYLWIRAGHGRCSKSSARSQPNVKALTPVPRIGAPSRCRKTSAIEHSELLKRPHVPQPCKTGWTWPRSGCAGSCTTPLLDDLGRWDEYPPRARRLVPLCPAYVRGQAIRAPPTPPLARLPAGWARVGDLPQVAWCVQSEPVSSAESCADEVGETFHLVFLGPYSAEIDRMRPDLILEKIKRGWTAW